MVGQFQAWDLDQVPLKDFILPSRCAGRLDFFISICGAAKLEPSMSISSACDALSADGRDRVPARHGLLPQVPQAGNPMMENPT